MKWKICSLTMLIVGLIAVGSLAIAEEVEYNGPMDGTWYLEYTWEGYFPGYAYWYIDARLILGTFETSEGYTGKTLYIPKRNMVFLKYDVGTLYQGTMSADKTYMSGTMEDPYGYPGTWQAWKETTGKTLPSEGPDSSGK